MGKNTNSVVPGDGVQLREFVSFSDRKGKEMEILLNVYVCKRICCDACEENVKYI